MLQVSWTNFVPPTVPTVLADSSQDELDWSPLKILFVFSLSLTYKRCFFSIIYQQFNCVMHARMRNSCIELWTVEMQFWFFCKILKKALPLISKMRE
jgi:hypothetical protein